MLNNPRDIFAAYIAIGVAVPSCLLVGGWKSNDPTVIKLSATVATIITIFFIGIQSYFMRKSIDEVKNERLSSVFYIVLGMMERLKSDVESNKERAEKGEWGYFKKLKLDKYKETDSKDNRLSALGIIVVAERMFEDYLSELGIEKEIRRYNEFVEKLQKSIDKIFDEIKTDDKCWNKIKELLQNSGEKLDVNIKTAKNIYSLGMRYPMDFPMDPSLPQMRGRLVRIIEKECTNKNSNIKNTVQEKEALLSEISNTLDSIHAKITKTITEISRRMLSF